MPSTVILSTVTDRARIKACPHDWQRLFTEPTAENSIIVRFAYTTLNLQRGLLSRRRCALCGAVSSLSQGYQRGGGRKVYISDMDPRMEAQAAAWNARVEKDRIEPEKLEE